MSPPVNHLNYIRVTILLVRSTGSTGSQKAAFPTGMVGTLYSRSASLPSNTNSVTVEASLTHIGVHQVPFEPTTGEPLIKTALTHFPKLTRYRSQRSHSSSVIPNYGLFLQDIPRSCCAWAILHSGAKGTNPRLSERVFDSLDPVSDIAHGFPHGDRRLASQNLELPAGTPAKQDIDGHQPFGDIKMAISLGVGRRFGVAFLRPAFTENSGPNVSNMLHVERIEESGISAPRGATRTTAARPLCGSRRESS